MKDHAIPDTDADESIEMYLPMEEELLFWPAAVDAEEEVEEQQQQESYASYETVDAAVGDDRYATATIETYEYMPRGDAEHQEQQQQYQHQNQNLDTLVNDCVRAIDELCLFSDQLKIKIDALEAKVTEAEENFNEE